MADVTVASLHSLLKIPSIIFEAQIWQKTRSGKYTARRQHLNPNIPIMATVKPPRHPLRRRQIFTYVLVQRHPDGQCCVIATTTPTTERKNKAVCIFSTPCSEGRDRHKSYSYHPHLTVAGLAQ